jgi:hypothetical protein
MKFKIVAIYILSMNLRILTLFLEVKFQVFIAVTMKNAVFWDVASCRSSLNIRFGGTNHFHLQGRKVYLEDGGDTFFRNFGSHKIYVAPHPRRRHSLL